jgi:hypothetical protein
MGLKTCPSLGDLPQLFISAGRAGITGIFHMHVFDLLFFCHELHELSRI